MADTSSSSPVRVTAEERTHPAIAKLARALIALARLRHIEEAEADELNAAADREVEHG